MTDVANPLVAARQDSTTGWTGIGIADSIDDLITGVNSGSWIDATIGGFGTSMEALVAVTDPLGALVSWGVGWLIEHVKPLSDALDWLAGDPDQITAYAATWHNVSRSVTSTAEDLDAAVRGELVDWSGAAASAYRGHVGEQIAAMNGIAKAAQAMGQIVEGAGLVVALVREMVRDLIADFVSVLAVRLWEWLAEAGFTLGVATPLVIAQVGALVAKWVAKIAGLISGLINTMRRLTPILRHLDELIENLKALIQRLARGGTGGRTAGPADMGKRSHWRGRRPAMDPQAPTRPADSHLPGGDPVYYQPSATAIGYDSSTMRNFDSVQREPGYHDVVVHGERNGLFRPGLVGSDGADYPANYTHPNQIAEAIRNNPHYDGGPVRLVSCHSATVNSTAGAPPPAQQVADALGVPVMAPTNAVGVDRYGPDVQVPFIRDGGTWVTFLPGGGRA